MDREDIQFERLMRGIVIKDYDNLVELNRKYDIPLIEFIMELHNFAHLNDSSNITKLKTKYKEQKTLKEKSNFFYGLVRYNNAKFKDRK